MEDYLQIVQTVLFNQVNNEPLSYNRMIEMKVVDRIWVIFLWNQFCLTLCIVTTWGDNSGQSSATKLKLYVYTYSPVCCRSKVLQIEVAETKQRECSSGLRVLLKFQTQDLHHFTIAAFFDLSTQAVYRSQNKSVWQLKKNTYKNIPTKEDLYIQKNYVRHYL